MGRGADLRRGTRVPAALLAREPGWVRGMFGDIAARYDLMNRLMTAGRDRRWRRLAAVAAGLRPGDHALDACCGTGDLAFSLLDVCPGCTVTGLDATPAMLALAEAKAAARRRRGEPAAVRFVLGDLLDLPFADDSFAAVTVGWGLRNVPDLGRALREAVRVTRPGGRVVCLDSTRPEGVWQARVHALWSGRLVPALGRVVTGHREAYAYLPESVATFPDAPGLAAAMAAAGLVRVRYRRLALGGVALHVGEVPA